MKATEDQLKAENPAVKGLQALRNWANLGLNLVPLYAFAQSYLKKEEVAMQNNKSLQS